MDTPAGDKSTQLFQNYIVSRKIVIADTSSAARTGLARALVDLGAKTANITLCGDYPTAVDAIGTQKPHVVICDYDLGTSCGLDLLQSQRAQRPDESKESLFVLVTGNTSQSAVAQAAEEDIDTYILKPYTIEILRQSIMKAAIAKIYPSDYRRKIDQGKEALFGGDPAKAMEIFAEALKLDPKPSLAHFYHGQAHFMLKAMDEARGDYDTGLSYNKIHYKCMVGLFEVLMSKKLYTDAYEVVKKISRYFPANPQRLSSVLRLAVMTRNYADIERYYQMFTQIDQRPEELIRYVCAALVVCGKHYLHTNYTARAMELFDKAAVTAAGRTKILREIIVSLVESDHAKEAEKFLGRFPPAIRGQADYLAMEYYVKDKLVAASTSISAGRELLAKGINDYYVLVTLMERSYEAGFGDAADQLAGLTVSKYGDRRREIEEAQGRGRAKAPKKSS